MGEKAEIGAFTYQAIETRWPMTLEGRSAKDRFFLVRISVINTGANQETIPGLEVVDDAGNAFPEVADGGGVPDWLGVSRRLASANTQQGVVVFDVPPKHYRLRVSDDADNSMFIDIPLNLNSEEPESKKIEGLVPLK
jgi:hypothetical protein